MSRHPRNFLPEIPLHIIQRGNNRHACFFTDRDYIVYLDKLLESSITDRVAIHSYVLGLMRLIKTSSALLTTLSIRHLEKMLASVGIGTRRYSNS
ncbi:MAG TPA: hypothetical protein EYO00_03025 [Gammaproteobacteria bacterium]|nr:hypothetical protein [Gammaproteobacteria bacterium]HIF88147.1 hypothetical protein [Gammaproteobacteria bacterium]HIL62086.1 hypothetical protein [Porticoccaceae bacterium]HIN90325.1 hypothetical protein [Porticoccaceae bacterium]